MPIDELVLRNALVLSNVRVVGIADMSTRNFRKAGIREWRDHFHESTSGE
jgi:hypothetical protein